MSNYKNFPIIISGPSGSGKTRLIEYIEKKSPDYIEAFGCTTRDRRPGEVTAMYFIERENFESMIQKDCFIEYCEYNGNYYGVPKSELSRLAETNLMFNVGYSSAKIIKELDERSKMIFLLPPTKLDLINRLEARGIESHARYTLGMEETINYALKYEYLLLSHQDDMESVYNDFMEIATQTKKSSSKSLVLAKNRDFVTNYYK